MAGMRVFESTPFRGAFLLGAVFFAMAILASPAARPLSAQLSEHRTPTTAYYSAFVQLYDGDYADALRRFQSEGRGAIKNAQSRWIDSICYEALCGECYFQMGLLDEALQHFTAALQIYQRFPDWMLKVQFPALIRLANPGARKVVPWGVSTRQSQLGAYPSSSPIAQGQIDMNDVVQRGGVVQQANFYPITPQEIVRATTLAIRRRATLLGPLCKHDPLTAELIAAVSRPIGPANHWSECWANLERGLALASGGKDTQAVGYLQRAVLAAGEFDHPLTPIALLELGRLALQRGEYPVAAKFFDEATYAAVNYPDCGVLEEAFRYGLLTHLAANRKGLYPPLEPALQWAKVNKLRELRASLLLEAAENYAVLGETRQAGLALDDARATIARRTMGASAIGARLSYLSALVAFQQRRTAEGNTALAAAMSYMRHGSLWLFYVAQADQWYVSGRATPRVAMDLFGEVLRDPLPGDWVADPMEAMASLVVPHPVPLEHWFEVAIDRKESQAAIEVAEQARRRRFFSSLEFGGRLESLRWILEAPVACLPKQAQLQRQDMLARYPAYSELSQQAQKIHAALMAQPLVGDDQATSTAQARALGELATASAKQEAILREIALRREPASLVFPPQRSVPDVQKMLPDKQAVLAFFATGRRLYGFLLNNERFAFWQVGSPATLLKQMQGMLRDMGQYQANHELTVKELADTRWKQSAQQVLETLLKGSPADFTLPLDELVVVPDGILWYLPFDALQVMIDGQPQSLISRFRIRYAPTLSLVAAPGPGRNLAGNTAVVLGKLYPRDEDSVTRAAFDQLAAVVPGAVALRTPPPAASSVFGTLFQRLVVLDDMPLTDQDPYGWAPAPLDRGKPGSSLADWLLLPWGGPDVIVLPGFHTAAEDSLKRLRKGPPGNEMFLSACGLMANGTRTLLLSRWRTGGQSSFDLVREFTEELSHTSPADAWQRAVLLTLDAPLNLEAEPRVKRTPTDEQPRADHPLFWAGYMLVDCGTAPEPKTEEPAAKPKPASPPAGKQPPPLPENKNPPAGQKRPHKKPPAGAS
jgi:tetratricopeptide (TPR) repeat protein